MQYSNPFANPDNLKQQPTREMLEGWLRENKAEAQKIAETVVGNASGNARKPVEKPVEGSSVFPKGKMKG